MSHRNSSGGVIYSTGREGLGKISPEGLPLTQNPTGSVSALPGSLPAGTLRGGVIKVPSIGILSGPPFEHLCVCVFLYG